MLEILYGIGSFIQSQFKSWISGAAEEQRFLHKIHKKKIILNTLQPHNLVSGIIN